MAKDQLTDVLIKDSLISLIDEVKQIGMRACPVAEKIVEANQVINRFLSKFKITIRDPDNG